MFVLGVFSYCFVFNFGRFFVRFSRRPTLDFIAIYNEFVGCAFFREVGKVAKMSSQSQLNSFPNASKSPPKWGQVAETHPEIVTEFWMAPKIVPKAPKNGAGKPTKNHRNINRVVDRISDAMFHDIVLIFAAAQPSISLLFITLSWDAASFPEFGNYQQK